jgi:D-glycero-D-manno-heptose 1,7-bisphosphate phosphatase
MPPAPGCPCAKPLPGLGLRAAAELGLDLPGSFMIGDKVDDALFGLNLGAAPVLVLTGYGRTARAALAARGLRPAHTAADVLEAADWIIEHGRGPAHGPV